MAKKRQMVIEPTCRCPSPTVMRPGNLFRKHNIWLCVLCQRQVIGQKLGVAFR